MRGVSDNWWAPVWRGLVVDSEGKHVRRLSKGALAIFLYLILHAKRESGFVARKQATIASDMGFSKRSVRRWIKILMDYQYISLERTGRAMHIAIRHWRSIGKRPGRAGLTGQDAPIRADRGGRDVQDDGRNRKQTSGDSGPRPSANESTSKRDSLRKRDSLFDTPPPTPGKGWREAVSREHLLARDLADGLSDRVTLSRYLELARKHPESLLRQLLSEAQAVPPDRIKRSRAALFEYLLTQHHLHGHTTNPGA